MAEENNASLPEFTIWVDADACPRDVRDLVVRTALKRGILTIFVANTPMTLPRSAHLDFRLVPHGPDKADDHIVDHAGGLDIAVTGDIPLAARLVEKAVTVLNPRGEELSSANIGDRLATRNLMEDLRSAGMVTGGPKEFGRADMQRFANALDRILTRRRQGKK